MTEDSRSTIEVFSTIRVEGEGKEQVVVKVHDAIIYSNGAEINNEEGYEKVPSLFIMFGPLEKEEPFAIEKVVELRDFFANRYGYILESVTACREGASFLTPDLRRYVIIEERDILESLVEKLPKDIRRKLLREDDLLGFVPVYKLH